jgi:hypothetical protein
MEHTCSRFGGPHDGTAGELRAIPRATATSSGTNTETVCSALELRSTANNAKALNGKATAKNRKATTEDATAN